MKVFFTVNHSGCAWWRARQPARMIKKLGLADIKVYDQETTERTKIFDDIKWADILIAQSPAGIDTVAMLVKYQEMGKKVVVDYDDLTFSCSPFNPAYKTLGLKEVKIKKPDGSEQMLWKDGVKGFSLKDNYFSFRSQQDIINQASLVTVTTDHLKKAYEKMLPEDGSQNHKIKVLPNSIDFNLYKPFPKKKHDHVRIGWIASSSHASEIWLVRNIFHGLFKKYTPQQIKIVMLGEVPSITNNFNPKYFESHRFADSWVYPLKFASMQFDIGIAPLEKNEFNENKSQLKWSEYGALRIPCVATRLEPYKCVKEGETGLLAEQPDEWVEKLSTLIEDEALRKKIGDNAFDYNYEYFNLEKNAKNWVEVYEGIL